MGLTNSNNVFGRRKRRKWKKKERKNACPFFCLVVREKKKKNECGGVMFFPWDPLFCYQLNLGRNRRKGEQKFYRVHHFIQ